MRINLDELHNRIRTDSSFKKRLRKLVLIAGIGVVSLAVIALIGFVYFSSAIISLIFSNVPVLYEVAFNYVRDFSSSFMMEDLTSILNSVSGGTNVTEMKNLVTQYFDQLGSSPAIDFQSFQNFVTTVKKTLIDNQITNGELELVRKFLLN